MCFYENNTSAEKQLNEYRFLKCYIIKEKGRGGKMSFPTVYYTVCSHQLSILYIGACICQFQSPNSLPPFPPWCSYICSLCLCLYFCFNKWFVCTIFSIFHIYVLIYVIFFYLSYLSLHDSLQVHSHLCNWHGFVSFYG